MIHDGYLKYKGSFEMEYVYWASGLSVAFALLFLILSYNRLAALGSRCNRANADIEVQLHHRYSLLPNLLELLKGAKSQDLAIIDAVGKARAMALQAASPQAKMEAEHAMSMTMQQAIVSADKLPETHANEHFRQLRNEVADCENKIAASRRFLNVAVDEYNASRDQFPNNVIAKFTGSSAREFYVLGEKSASIMETPSLKMQ
jgi:LemA protein